MIATFLMVPEWLWWAFLVPVYLNLALSAYAVFRAASLLRRAARRRRGLD